MATNPEEKGSYVPQTEKDAAKAPYTTPALTKFGDVVSITGAKTNPTTAGTTTGEEIRRTV